MSKRLSNPAPFEGNQTPENIVVSGAGQTVSQLKANLRTPRPLTETDVLFRVELALSRLDNGDYGYCVRCSDPISIEKLERDPASVICDACRSSDS